MSTTRMRWMWALVLLAAGLWAAGCPDGGPADAGVDADAADDGDGADEPDGGLDDGEELDGADGDADEGPVELTLSAVLPSRGPRAGGTWVNILGSGFVRGIGESPFDARDVTDVTFGENPAIDIEVVRDDMISVRTPPGVDGPCEVVVQNPNGRVGLAFAFTYYDTLSTGLISPTDLAAGGGTPFSVEGSGFTADTRVLVGGRLAPGLSLEGAARLQAVAPPGSPGRADLEVVNRNGRALVFQAMRYHARPRLDAVEPPAGAADGGTPVTLRGAGFDESCQAWLGGQAATGMELLGEDRLAAVTPPGTPGPAEVRVACAVEEARLDGGFVYLAPAAGVLALTGVAPRSGSQDGGERVALCGEGFAAGLVEALFGAGVATELLVQDDRLAWATTPAGAPGAVDVRVGDGAGSALAGQAYRYFTPLELESVEPAEVPAAGGAEFTLRGDGFHAGVEVRVGGRLADAVVVLSAGELHARCPEGSPGPVEIEVRDEDSRATLPWALSGTLELLRAEPDAGGQAGGTYVLLLGDGLGADARVWFGESEASVIQALSPSLLAVRSPRGEPGEVTVAVERGGARVELPAGFSYFDPTNDRGGASGGPLRGALYVTALDGSYLKYGAPLPGATVLLEEPALRALTDDRGQATFSGPSLVRAVTVTIGKEGYQATTLVALDASALTVYLFPNEQEPIEPGNGDPPKVSVLSGRVFGFKDVPWLPVPPGGLLEAQVNFTAYSLYSVPPFAGVPVGTVIAEDGGAFEWTVRLGEYSLVALYGVSDPNTGEFTPGLMGVRRAIQVPSEEPVGGQDIVLGTPLDQGVLVHLLDPPMGTMEEPVQYGAYVSLDLGRDGVVYLDQSVGASTELALSHMPAASADSFLFVGQASNLGGYPYSFVFGRQAGDLSAGIALGPFLGFPRITSPEPDGPLTGGRIAWQVDGPAPMLTQLLVQTSDLIPRVLWRVILPGDQTEVTLPEELLGLLPRGEPLLLLIYTANSPRFDFDRFNYSQLSTGRWTAYTVNFASFTAP